jgi:helix-turn-helix protein
MAGRGNGDGRAARERHRRAALAHPVRQGIVQLLAGRRLTEAEIAAELAEKRGWVGYHLRVLVGVGALKALARGPRTAIYRRAPGAHWVHELLGEDADEAET